MSITEHRIAVRPRPLALALLAMLLGFSPASPALAREAQQTTAAITVGTTHRLRSKVLGDTRELNVRLPADYAAGRGPYRVLYLLDGGLEQDFLHIAGLAQLGDLSGTFGPFIVVGVQT